MNKNNDLDARGLESSVSECSDSGPLRFEKTARHLSTVVFPWDIERALEFALYRSYAVPSISALLSYTGEFSRCPQRRYDDTELLLSEVMENGFSSDRAHQAIDRINAMHGRYKIKNDDMLYVLSTFVFEPIRWLAQYAWRPMTDAEQQDWFCYYQQLGERMGIENIPGSLEAFEEFNQRYEHEHFVYSDTNREIADMTGDLLLGFYLPKCLFGLGRPLLYSLLDPPLRRAFDYPTPAWPWRWLAVGSLKCRALLLKWLPKNRKPVYITQRQRPSYPMGYAIAQLGTFDETSAEEPSS